MGKFSFLLLALNAAAGLCLSAGSDGFHPLPPTMQIAKRSAKFQTRDAPSDLLPRGAWLLRIEPVEGPILDGTLRVEKNTTSVIISGDLYNTGKPQPSPANGIPVFPRKQYDSYVRVTSLKAGPVINFLDLDLEIYKFSVANGKAVWTKSIQSGNFVTLEPSINPTARVIPNEYWHGTLIRKDTNEIIGQLSIRYIGPLFRKITVEVDGVANSELPADDGAGHSWKSVFNAVDYDITVAASDKNVAESNANGWFTDADLHAAMLKKRAATNFDTEWRVHLLSVRRINSTERGVMYDVPPTDTNATPREGAGVASGWVYGTLNNGKPDGIDWGTEKGKRFGTSKAAFFHEAVHVVGQALSLQDIAKGTGFGTALPDVAKSAPGKFPASLTFDFAPVHQLYLRHLSDVHIRPGFQALTAVTPTTPVGPSNVFVNPAGGSSTPA